MKLTKTLTLLGIIMSIFLISCEKESEQIQPDKDSFTFESDEDVKQMVNEAMSHQPIESIKDAGPLQTVDFVDLNRYQGRWFEIARLPNFFNQNCTCTTADYGIGENGVNVSNNCTLSTTGATNSINGTAVVVDSETNAKLQISFPDVPFPGNYWIIDLAADNGSDPYQFAVVSEPTRESLFILSRTPRITTFRQKAILIKSLIKLIRQGYDIRKIQISPQVEGCVYP